MKTDNNKFFKISLLLLKDILIKYHIKNLTIIILEDFLKKNSYVV